MSIDFSDGDIAKCGWLERKGLTLGRWATRFIILRDAFLFVCRQQPTALADGIAHPDHVIWLHAAGGAVTSTPGSKSGRFFFTVSVTEPYPVAHLLSAHSEEERDSWVEKINDALHIIENEDAERPRSL